MVPLQDIWQSTEREFIIHEATEADVEGPFKETDFLAGTAKRGQKIKWSPDVGIQGKQDLLLWLWFTIEDMGFYYELVPWFFHLALYTHCWTKYSLNHNLFIWYLGCFYVLDVYFTSNLTSDILIWKLDSFQ